MIKRFIIISVILLQVALVLPADAQLTDDQAYSLFNQANESFRQANAAEDSDQAQRLYKNAILSFEKITTQGRIKNPKLYYNLANAYLLKGDVGKAILNYRRAEKLDSSDTNIQKNLTFARSKRIDTVTIKTEKRVLQTLFFWHYDFAVRTKLLLTCVFFGIVCLSVAVMIWRGKSALWLTSSIITAILTIALLSSLIIESQTNKISGVITADQVTALQGPGQNYSPSFKEPLHAGTEFNLIESRPCWLYIKLSDSSDGWIPDASAEII